MMAPDITAMRFVTPPQSLHYVFNMCNDGTFLLSVLEKQLDIGGSGIQLIMICLKTHLCRMEIYLGSDNHMWENS